MNGEIQTVVFHGSEIVTAEKNGGYYAAMKPICEAIGLQWHGQFERIKRHPVLSEGIRVIRTVAEDGKQREMLMLPIEYLNGWLFGIDVNRVKPEIRDRLIEYQRECFRVLDKYWRSKSQQGDANISIKPDCSNELHVFLEVTRGRLGCSKRGRPYNSVSMTTALVLQYLYHQTDGPELIISKRQMADELKIGRTTVSRALERMQRWSFISLIKTNLGESTKLCLNLDAIDRELDISRNNILANKQQVGFLPFLS